MQATSNADKKAPSALCFVIFTRSSPCSQAKGSYDKRGQLRSL
jgi:hypothetical protein